MELEMKTVKLIKLKAKRDALEFARKIVDSVLRHEIDAVAQKIAYEEKEMKKPAHYVSA